MKKYQTALFIFLLIGCSNKLTPIQKSAIHYQNHNDYESLKEVVNLLPPNSDTADVKKLLGEPIDMGFDYRYLLEETGENGCVIGAVFHINEYGKIDQKWIDEICE